MVDFGNILKTLRLRENMTQAQLAQKLGLTKSVISAYETGLRLPSYDILIHIAKIYNVSTDYLFFASTFWTKLQNIFGHCCMSKLDKVAKRWPVMIRPAI